MIERYSLRQQWQRAGMQAQAIRDTVQFTKYLFVAPGQLRASRLQCAAVILADVADLAQKAIKESNGGALHRRFGCQIDTVLVARRRVHEWSKRDRDRLLAIEEHGVV